jgi:hypothetical protein
LQWSKKLCKEDEPRVGHARKRGAKNQRRQLIHRPTQIEPGLPAMAIRGVNQALRQVTGSVIGWLCTFARLNLCERLRPGSSTYPTASNLTRTCFEGWNFGHRRKGQHRSFHQTQLRGDQRTSSSSHLRCPYRGPRFFAVQK